MKKNIVLLLVLISVNISWSQILCNISPTTKKVGDELTKEKNNANDSKITGDYRIEGNGWILLPDHTGGLFIENVQVNELIWVLKDLDGRLGIEVTTIKDELSSENKLIAENQVKFIVEIISNTDLNFFNPLVNQTLKLKRYPLIKGKVYSKIKEIDLKYTPKENNAAPLTILVDEPTEIKDSDDNIYNTAGIDVRPEFFGGMEKFYKFIGSNFKMPQEEVKGKVFVTFIIEKDGSLSDIKVLRDIGFGTGAEAIRVLSQSPKWKPGELAGKKVRVHYSLPISVDTTK